MSESENETLAQPPDQGQQASTPPQEGEGETLTHPETGAPLTPDEAQQAQGEVTQADEDETADEGHTSTVTDLPEGAEVDPLSDQRPEPVVEKDTYDE